jgi:hypothetical protein
VVGKKAPKPNSVAHQQSRARGFALDLASGGPDGEDADFGCAAGRRRNHGGALMGPPDVTSSRHSSGFTTFSSNASQQHPQICPAQFF